MNDTIFRHALELLVCVPASIICLRPVQDKLRWPPALVVLAVALTELSFVSAAAAVCMKFDLPSAYTSLVMLPLFFGLYLAMVKERWPKLLFCFSAAVMLSCFCVMYTHFIAAPWEIDTLTTFSPRTSLICLGLAFFCVLMFWNALSVQLPYLFSLARFDDAWVALSLVCVLLSMLFRWIIPVDLSTVLVGRLRVVALSVLPLFPLVILLLSYLCYRLARHLARQAALTQENDLLRAEARRYLDLSRHQQETRILRHDFKQHLHVIADLAQAGKRAELLDYLAQLEAAPGQRDVSYCANPAVDALAAHYAELAAAQEIAVRWALELPAELPMPEAAFCGMLGNLLDNALRAVSPLPPERRHVEVICRMLSPKMLGLTVENPYEGKLRLGPDGLPVARQKGHGLGLLSVSATVRRYHGTLTIDSADGKFAVNALMNF